MQTSNTVLCNRLRRLPKVPHIDDPSSPYTLAEREADEVTESYEDRYFQCFPLKDPRWYSTIEHLFERDTLERILDVNQFDDQVFNPLGGNHEHLTVPRASLESAIKSNLLSPNEIEYLREAVSQYNKRSHRRDLYQAEQLRREQCVHL